MDGLGAAIRRAATIIAILPAPAQSAVISLQGGQSHSLAIHATGDLPQLLLVEQRGIDVRVECSAGAIANAPTGRLGYEAVWLEVDASCVIRPKMSGAVRGSIDVRTYSGRLAALDAQPSDWRLYAALLMLDDEVKDAQTGAIAGFEQLLDRALPGALELNAQLALASLLRRSRQFERALGHYDRASQLALQSGRSDWLPALKSGAGLSWLALGEYEQARKAFAAALDLAADADDGYETASAQNNLCLVDHYQGRLRPAFDCYRLAVRRYESAGELQHRATALYNLGAVAQQLGEPDVALDALEGALKVRRSGPYDRSLGNALLQLSTLHGRMGDAEQALRHSLDALALFEKLGSPDGLARAHRVRAAALRIAGDRGRALQHSRQSIEFAALTGDSDLIAAALAESARSTEPDAAAAESHLQAAGRYDEAGMTARAFREQARAILRLAAAGQAARAQAQWDVARARWRTGRQVPGDLQDLVAARVALANRDYPRAIDYAERSRRERERRADVVGQLEASRPIFEAAMASDHQTLARQALDSMIGLRLRLTSALPSPSTLEAFEREHGYVADAVLDWHQRWPGQTATLWMDLQQLRSLPVWRAQPEFDLAWRRYRFALARLREDELKVGEKLALEQVVERESSRLELMYSRAAPRSPQTFPQARQMLAPDTAILAVLVGSRRGELLWADNRGIERRSFALKVRAEDPTGELAGILTQDRAIRARLRKWPVGRLWIVGERRLTALDVSSLLCTRSCRPDAVAAIHVLGPLDTGAMRQPGLPPDFRVAAIDLGGDDQALPGATREYRFMREHYGARMSTVTPVASASETVGAEVVHLAAHGVVDVAHPLASALQSDARGTGLAVSSLRFGDKVRLVVLNACEAGGTSRATGAWSMAMDVAQNAGAMVIAPATTVRDDAAYRFARRLHTELEGGDVVAAFQSSVASWRTEYPGEPMPWRLLIAPQRNHLLGESPPLAQNYSNQLRRPSPRTGSAVQLIGGADHEQLRRHLHDQLQTWPMAGEHPATEDGRQGGAD